jgi:ABC-type dipeptide/oligopeptide/nickel transport system permease component
MAVLIIGAASIILSNLIADILYAYLDPRIRYE